MLEAFFKPKNHMGVSINRGSQNGPKIYYDSYYRDYQNRAQNFGHSHINGSKNQEVGQ